jgi:hypothetical protein
MKAKTLIISGTYQHNTQPVILGVRHTVIYNVTIYGQSPESPEVGINILESTHRTIVKGDCK